MQNIRRSRMQPTQVVSLDTVKKIVNEMQNPIVEKEKPLPWDSGAFRAYNYHLLNKHL